MVLACRSAILAPVETMFNCDPPHRHNCVVSATCGRHVNSIIIIAKSLEGTASVD